MPSKFNLCAIAIRAMRLFSGVRLEAFSQSASDSIVDRETALLSIVFVPKNLFLL